MDGLPLQQPRTANGSDSYRLEIRTRTSNLPLPRLSRCMYSGRSLATLRWSVASYNPSRDDTNIIMHLRLLAPFVLAICGTHAAHAAVEVRFHPPDGIWLHDTDAARQLTSAVIHNTALINRGEDAVTVAGLRFDVLRQGQVVVSQSLDIPTLDALARRSARMQESGLLDALAFQFAPQRLFGKHVALAPTRTLAPGTALLVPSQLLVFAAPADSVQVSVDVEGNDVDSVASLPIRAAALRAFRFPLEGRWLIGAGATPHNHHRWTPAEEFALDISRVGASGGTYARDGAALRDYYGWRAPVLAAADGEVVGAVDRYPDNVAMLRRPGEPMIDYRKRLFAAQDEWLGDIDGIAGNHVIVRHDGGLYSVYAHLKRGSVAVEVGQRLRGGTRLGSLGSSGNSTEPHLHFHVCDAPHPLNCAGVPVRFDNIEIPWAERDRQLQSGDLVETR